MSQVYLTFAQVLEALSSKVHTGMTVEEFIKLAIKSGYGPLEANSASGLWVNYAAKDAIFSGSQAVSSATATASELIASSGASATVAGSAAGSSTIVASNATMTATATASEISSLPTAFEVVGSGSGATISSGATILGTSLPTAFSALAPLLGVGIGVGLYKMSPDFWEKVSRTLLPFCYKDTEILPILLDEKGQTYYPKEVIDSLYDLFVKENIYDVKYETNMEKLNGKVYIDTSNVCSLYDLLNTIPPIWYSNTLSKDDSAWNWWNQYRPNYNKELIAKAAIPCPRYVYDYLLNNTDCLSGEYNVFIVHSGAFQNGGDVMGPTDSFSVTIWALKMPSGYYTFENGSLSASTFPKHKYYYLTCSFNSVTNQEQGILNPPSELNWSGTENPSSGAYPHFDYYYDPMSSTRLCFKYQNSNLKVKVKDGAPQGATIISGDHTYSKDGMKNIVTSVDSDGNIKTGEYIPVRLPSTNDGSSTSTKDNSQSNLDSDGNVSPDIIAQIIESIRNMYDPQPNIKYDPNTDPSVKPETNEDSFLPNKNIIPPVIPSDPNDVGETPPLVPSISPHASGLLTVYNPTQSEISQFGKWLWTTWSGDLLDTISKMFNNPMEAVIGLHSIYCTPPQGEVSTIKAGYLDSNVPSITVPERYTSLFCGSVIIPEWWGNYLDFSPYTKAYVYLPFIGIQELDPMDIIGSAVSIEYKIDVFNGSCIALINVAKDGYEGVLYEFSGNCAVQIPITSGNYSSILSSAIAVGASVAATALTGGAGAPILAGAIGSVSRMQTSVQHSGTFSASHGAMGIKTPYIIIKRPVQKVIPNYNTLYGFPSHKFVRIRDCKGYLRVKEVDVKSLTATDEEKRMIERILKEGIYVS